MQTTFKKVKLAGHESETEVTVRHRSTLGRFEATSKDYPHLTGEGDTEALALKDLGEMLSSDPVAHAAIQALNAAAKAGPKADVVQTLEPTEGATIVKG